MVTNPSPHHPVPAVCRILCSNVRSLARNLSDLTVAPSQECDCCEMLVFMVCGVRQNIYVCSLYCNPDLDNPIFYCLLASMDAVQAENVRASFLFVGDLNGHHQEWLGSSTTNRHGVVAFDFATVSGCNQLVVGPRGGTLDVMDVVEHLTF